MFVFSTIPNYALEEGWLFILENSSNYEKTKKSVKTHYKNDYKNQKILIKFLIAKDNKILKIRFIG